jgi:hypothetical protein
LRREERRLRLEPGERRRLEWTVSAPCTLTGRTLDADGNPAQGVTVWLVPDLDGVLQDFTVLGHAKENVAAKASSGPDGRFTLEVGAGQWQIGPAPEQDHARSVKGRLVDIAPAVTPLVIEPGQERAEVTLTCWCGLFLRGTVRDPEGKPVRSGYVTARGEDDSPMDMLADGTFSIGPLVPGSYLVHVTSDDPELVDSEGRTVAAGTEHIEIVLGRGSSLSARVLDADGDPVADAQVWILSGRKYGNRSRTSAGGEVKFGNLPGGTFSISASTAAGEYALERVTLGTGNSPGPIELHLAPAARLRVDVQHGPETALQVVILQDGDPVGYMFLDESPVTALAPGEYELALWGKEEVQRKRVRVDAGNETRVAFDLAPR